jgi:ADP-ribosyl-[dinitrogen reductase] hydrolase
MRDIKNDLFEVKETYCESCKYNVLGKTWCSKYENRKPVDIMTGKTKCEKYCILNNVIMASIVGFAVGDALGVPVEFMSRDELRKNPVKDMIGNGTHNQEPGTWSDDTSLIIALIKALRDREFNVNSVANRMIDWLYKGKYTANGIVFDVGNTTRESIKKMYKGISPVEAGGKGEYDNGNGSLMRIHPLAFYLFDVDDFEDRKSIIYQVSSLTHANIVSKVACHFLVEFIIELLKTNDIGTAYDAVCSKFNKYYTEGNIQAVFGAVFSGKVLSMPASSVKSSGYVIDTLESVLWCVFHTTTYKDAVLTAVNLGNDTDTIGAITGGIAGIIYGFDAIPKEWVAKLANKIIIFNAANDLYKKCNRNDSMICDYLKKTYSMSDADIKESIVYLAEFSDIYNEFVQYVTLGVIDDSNCIEVEGYSANKLLNTTYLEPIGAYNYLVYLRRKPREALDKLKKGLPRK